MSSVHRTLQPGCIHGRPTMWTVVVAAVGFEAFTVNSPLMTGNRPDPPGRCRTDPATKSVVTQGKTGNDRRRRERPFRNPAVASPSATSFRSVWPPDRLSKGRLRRHHVMASPPSTHPIVSTGSPGMRKRGAAISHGELTTVLTPTMTTVGLAYTSSYTTTELVSCLVIPSACTYGSEGWGFEVPLELGLTRCGARRDKSACAAHASAAP